MRTIVAGRPPLALDPEFPLGEFHLLAIGIGVGYAQYDRLVTPVNGARKMADVLERKFGFAPKRTKLLLDADATRGNIIRALRQLVVDAGELDSVLIFFGGHGHWDEISRSGHWIPADARRDDPADWIGHSLVKEILGGAKARHILLISDSCFAGDLMREAAATKESISHPYVRHAFNHVSRHVLTSGANEPVPDGGTPDHSVFTSFLLRELEESTQPWILPHDLFSRVRGAVAVNTGQQPQFGHLKGTGGETDGEFVLFNRSFQHNWPEQPETDGMPQQPTVNSPPPAGIPPASFVSAPRSHPKTVPWAGLLLGLALATIGLLIWHLHSAAPVKVSSPPGQTSTSLAVSQPSPKPAAPPAENHKSEELVERETTRRHLNPETPITPNKSEQNPPKPSNEKIVADAHRLKNPYLENSSNQYSIAILIANETGQPNTQLAHALRQLLNTNGITTTASLFSPRFIADGLLDKTIAGSKEPLEQLDLKNNAHAVFLAQQSVEYSTNYELNGVITATMTVALNVLSTRPCELLFATAINAAGAGFSRPQARQMAEERILNQLGDGRLAIVQQTVLIQEK